MVTRSPIALPAPPPPPRAPGVVGVFPHHNPLAPPRHTRPSPPPSLEGIVIGLIHKLSFFFCVWFLLVLTLDDLPSRAEQIKFLRFA